MRLTAEDLAMRFKRLSSPDDTTTTADVFAFCTVLIASTLRDQGLTKPVYVRRLLGLLARQVQESLAEDSIH